MFVPFEIHLEEDKISQYRYCGSPVLSSLRLGRQGTQLEHPTHPHKLSKAKEGLYWITHPCPWLNNSAEIIHSPSFKERKMSKI